MRLISISKVWLFWQAHREFHLSSGVITVVLIALFFSHFLHHLFYTIQTLHLFLLDISICAFLHLSASALLYLWLLVSLSPFLCQFSSFSHFTGTTVKTNRTCNILPLLVSIFPSATPLSIRTHACLSSYLQLLLWPFIQALLLAPLFIDILSQ